MSFLLLGWPTLLFSIAMGLIVGSFLNVVIVRLPEGKSIVFPGSHCVHCKKKLKVWDNIPLLSFLWLQGKCRYCKKRISSRYPTVEVLTAVLFVACGMRLGWSSPLLVVRDWIFLSLLVAITFIDLEHRVIPDQLSLGGLVLGLLTYGLAPEWSFLQSFLGAVIGFSFFYSLSWLYYKMRGKLGLGGGDIKLLAMLGAFLGPMGVLVTVFVSSIFGSIVGLIWASALGKRKMMQFAIPYGPFLVIGALLYYFLGDVLWYLYTKQI